jgi:hypothetical protein
MARRESTRPSRDHHVAGLLVMTIQVRKNMRRVPHPPRNRMENGVKNLIAVFPEFPRCQTHRPNHRIRSNEFRKKGKTAWGGSGNPRDLSARKLNPYPRGRITIGRNGRGPTGGWVEWSPKFHPSSRRGRVGKGEALIRIVNPFLYRVIRRCGTRMKDNRIIS